MFIWDHRTEWRKDLGREGPTPAQAKYDSWPWYSGPSHLQGWRSHNHSEYLFQCLITIIVTFCLNFTETSPTVTCVCYLSSFHYLHVREVLFHLLYDHPLGSQRCHLVSSSRRANWALRASSHASMQIFKVGNFKALQALAQLVSGTWHGASALS